MELGSRVRAVRTYRKLTMTDIASSVGVSPQQMFKYERGLNVIPAHRLFRIAQIMSVNAAWLVTGQISESEETVERLTATEIKLLRAFRGIRVASVRNAALNLVCAASGESAEDGAASRQHRV